jgi:putative Holliday junction resolvase
VVNDVKIVAGKGAVVAVDVGTVRVGVAASDPERVLASPVETVAAPGHARVAEIVAERGAGLVIVGLPTSLSGRAASASAVMAREWAAALEQLVAVPVELVDERLTTVTAAAALRASGRRGKQARQVVDQAAAVALLQGYLDGLGSRS